MVLASFNLTNRAWFCFIKKMGKRDCSELLVVESKKPPFQEAAAEEDELVCNNNKKQKRKKVVYVPFLTWSSSSEDTNHEEAMDSASLEFESIQRFVGRVSSKSKKMVHFNCDGQPIGEGATSFVTYLGSVTRKHCPISFEHWKDVPDHIKEMIWKLVADEYLVSAAYKKQILQRVNKHWREFKCKLRSKHYDKYETDEERKINCPQGVQCGDWEIFVDNQSTTSAQARRGKGKSAREGLKTPHTFGRRGAARTVKAMKVLASRSHQQQSAAPNISGPSSAFGAEHASCADHGFSPKKKMVYFNEDGLPIGEGSVSFTSNLGSLTRRHCPVSYEQWRDVPDDTKDMIWKLVTDKYIVTEAFREQVLKRVGKHWREFKCQLRSKHYDRYKTDEERKKNCPRVIRQKDWDIFVENQSTPTAQARRKRGKSAREAMKTPHTSGRRGAARKAEDLKIETLSSFTPEKLCCLASTAQPQAGAPLLNI